MMLNINLDYNWIMGEPVKVLITKRQSPRKHISHTIWAGVSSTTPSLIPPALINACYIRSLSETGLKIVMYSHVMLCDVRYISHGETIRVMRSLILRAIKVNYSVTGLKR
jgi:hypothetical protein